MRPSSRLSALRFTPKKVAYIRTTKEELAALNVPFVCCSYGNPYGTLLRDTYSSYRWNPLESIWDMYQEYVELGKGFKVHKDSLEDYPGLEKADPEERKTSSRRRRRRSKLPTPTENKE